MDNWELRSIVNEGSVSEYRYLKSFGRVLPVRQDDYRIHGKIFYASTIANVYRAKYKSIKGEFDLNHSAASSDSLNWRSFWSWASTLSPFELVSMLKNTQLLNLDYPPQEMIKLNHPFLRVLENALRGLDLMESVRVNETLTWHADSGNWKNLTSARIYQDIVLKVFENSKQEYLYFINRIMEVFAFMKMVGSRGKPIEFNHEVYKYTVNSAIFLISPMLLPSASFFPYLSPKLHFEYVKDFLTRSHHYLGDIYVKPKFRSILHSLLLSFGFSQRFDSSSVSIDQRSKLAKVPGCTCMAYFYSKSVTIFNINTRLT